MTDHEDRDATLSAAIRFTPDGHENIFELVDLLEGEGADEETREKVERIVRVQNRKLQAEPPAEKKLARSQQRMHEFLSVGGFVEYLLKFGTANTIVMANPGRGEMRAVLDEKAPTGREELTLRPQIHPRIAPWIDLLEHWIPIHQFADFVIAHRRSVTKPDARVLAGELSQIRVGKDTTIHSGQGAKTVNSVTVTTLIQGTGADSLVEIPDVLEIQGPIFVDTDPVTFEIDVMVREREERVGVQVESSDFAEAKIAAFERMIGVIQTAVKSAEKADDFTLAMGSPLYQGWAVIQ